MKYSYVKYCMMRWDMIQDSWINVEVLRIVIEWSLVDNLVTSENKGNSAEIKKKNLINLSHIIQYLTLVKKYLRFHDIIIWGCCTSCAAQMVSNPHAPIIFFKIIFIFIKILNYPFINLIITKNQVENKKKLLHASLWPMDHVTKTILPYHQGHCFFIENGKKIKILFQSILFRVFIYNVLLFRWLT